MAKVVITLVDTDDSDKANIDISFEFEPSIDTKKSTTAAQRLALEMANFMREFCGNVEVESVEREM